METIYNKDKKTDKIPDGKKKATALAIQVDDSDEYLAWIFYKYENVGFSDCIRGNSMSSLRKNIRDFCMKNNISDFTEKMRKLEG